MNEIVKNQGMTARELAAQFGCTVRTVQRHAKKLFPRNAQYGVKSYFDEREVTLILDSIKNVKSPNKTATVNVRGLANE
jgi:transcriptional antiterminator